MKVKVRGSGRYFTRKDGSTVGLMPILNRGQFLRRTWVRGTEAYRRLISVGRRKLFVLATWTEGTAKTQIVFTALLYRRRRSRPVGPVSHPTFDATVSCRRRPRCESGIAKSISVAYEISGRGSLRTEHRFCSSVMDGVKKKRLKEDTKT